MYKLLLGSTFNSLPDSLRAVHRSPGTFRFSGTCNVRRGSSLIARLLADAASLPPAGPTAIVVTIESSEHGEVWTRQFGKHRMQSVVQARDNRLHESVGLARFVFELVVEPRRVRWELAEIRALGLKLPRHWFDLDVSEYDNDDRYHFDVRVQMPVIGLLVHYAGSLQ